MNTATKIILALAFVLAALASIAPDRATAGNDTDGNWNSRPTPAAVNVNWSS